MEGNSVNSKKHKRLEVNVMGGNLCISGEDGGKLLCANNGLVRGVTHSLHDDRRMLELILEDALGRQPNN